MAALKNIIFYVAPLVILVIMEILIIKRHKRLIRESVESRGEKVVKIAWEPFDFDKSNHTYWVQYENANGEIYSRYCKIHAWGSSIYWEE